jgi:hypothetical protein
MSDTELATLTVKPYFCDDCPGCLHARWVCPGCGSRNTCYLFAYNDEPETFETCEQCRLQVRLVEARTP